MLKDDHQTVEQLFKRFEKTGERAYTAKRETVDRIIEELSVHAAIEEQLFYPVVRATVPATDNIALESLEEHHIVKWVLSELQTMAPEDERFDAKVTVLTENVRHHIREEENEFFPLVRDELGRKALNDLGDAMAEARKTAPTHPHPRSPDSPPGNLVAGAAAGVVDHIGDTLNGLAQGGVTAVGDLIATVLGRKKPRVAPTGNKQVRSTAARVRAAASEATESAIETTRMAKRTGEKATRRARATGSSTATGTARTAAAAKRAATSTTRSASRAAASTTRTADRAATSTTRTANRAAKRTAGTAKRGATTTMRTAKRGAATTVRTAKRGATSTAQTAKRGATAAKRSARTK